MQLSRKSQESLFTKPSFSVAGDCTFFVFFTRKVQKRTNKAQQNSTRGIVKSGQAVLGRARDTPKTALLTVSNQGKSLLFNYTFKKSKLALACSINSFQFYILNTLLFLPSSAPVFQIHFLALGFK